MERVKLRRDRAVLAGLVGVVVVALAGPVTSASAHPATSAATAAAGQTDRPRAAPTATDCSSAATNSSEADGCLKNTSGGNDPLSGDHDPRLGPEQLPTTDPEGPVQTAVAKITAGYRRFGDLTEAAFLKMFWYWHYPLPVFVPTSGWKYPDYGGFVVSDGKPDYTQVELKKGYLVDRFGSPGGTYLSPAGTPYAERALPPSNLDYSSPPTRPPSSEQRDYNYHEYKVAEPFKVDAGKIAAWFGQKGGGMQYTTCAHAVTISGVDCTDTVKGKEVTLNVKYLLEKGYLTAVLP